MPRNTRTFSDLDLNFLAHPTTHDINLRYDIEAVKASVRNLILTSNYERLFHPEIGSQLKSLLFEPATPILGILIEKAIKNTIDNFEPRVNLTKVDVNMEPDNHTVYVNIQFTVLNIAVVHSINLILYRSR